MKRQPKNAAPAAPPAPPAAAETRPVLLTEAQVAELIQVAPRTLRRMVSTGRFPQPVKIGPNPESQQCPRRWVRAEVDAWLRQLMEARG
ncbi:MAG: helix-turn-helix transcriptional regulator [Planctomycetota bacterium]